MSITRNMYFHVPIASNSDMDRMNMERKVFEERYQMMMTRLDMMDAKLNAYNRTEVGSYSAVNIKSPISCDVGMKAQSKLKTKVIIFVIFSFDI